MATVGRGGLMLGPPGEQTSGSLLFCEHYITASVYGYLLCGCVHLRTVTRSYERPQKTYIYMGKIYGM